MSRTVHHERADVSNVIPFPVKRPAKTGCGVPLETMRQIADAWCDPAARFRPVAAMTEAEEDALYRNLVRKVGAMMRDPNCPLREGGAS